MPNSNFETYHELINYYRFPDQKSAGAAFQQWELSVPEERKALDSEDSPMQLPVESLEQRLVKLAENKLSFYLNVENQGVSQRYQGTIQKLLRTGSWFNILDPFFNLHLNTSKITAVWEANNPANGITELKAMDESGGVLRIGQFMTEH